VAAFLFLLTRKRGERGHMKALTPSRRQRAIPQQCQTLAQMKALLTELRGLTTAAATLPGLSPVWRHTRQASARLAERIRELEQRSRCHRRHTVVAKGATQS
jgi:hypothetical protein